MERDYPVGHPASADYKGQAYRPPTAPHAEDYPHGHPARGGANVGDGSTPDGMHLRVLEQHDENHQRTTEMIANLRDDHSEE